MADKFTIEIKGLTQLLANLSKIPAEIRKEAQGHLIRGAQVFVANAQRDAPVDFGRLRQGISYKAEPGVIGVELVSSAEYSPYLEWGTIEKVSVPPAEQSYAIQFKGHGIRKTGGISPHPFFFKNVPNAVATMEAGLKTIEKDLQL